MVSRAASKSFSAAMRSPVAYVCLPFASASAAWE
jgi:hypothetical protein